jgi:hypothetical protein
MKVLKFMQPKRVVRRARVDGISASAVVKTLLINASLLQEGPPLR